MRVLMIGPHKSLNGGVASVSRVLLAAFDRDPSVDLIELATIQTEKKLMYPANFLTFLIRLLWFSTTNKFDLAHIHLASKGSAFRKVTAMAILLICGKKYLVHLHGGKFDQFYLNLPGSLASVVRFYLQRANCVVALSKSWEQWLQETVHLQNTITIKNGAHNAKREIERISSTGKLLCLFGGRLEEGKGPDVLLKACSIPPLNSKVQIWFAGDGNIERYIALAKKLNIYDNCKFYGWMNQEDYYEKLNQADVFTLPSFAEGMPMSIIEAMSAGVPPISTMVGGIPELVTSGKTGVLVEPGDVEALHDAIKSFIADPGMRSVFSKACLEEYANKFSIEKMKFSFKSIYIEKK